MNLEAEKDDFQNFEPIQLENDNMVMRILKMRSSDQPFSPGKIG
jgi:hypothetical protein